MTRTGELAVEIRQLRERRARRRRRRRRLVLGGAQFTEGRRLARRKGSLSAWCSAGSDYSSACLRLASLAWTAVGTMPSIFLGLWYCCILLHSDSIILGITITL